MTPPLTTAMLKRLWPRCPQRSIDAIARAAPQVLPQYGLTTPLRLAHFMAQVSHECGGGTIVRENMNYSADRMLQIFGVGHHSAAVTPPEAVRLAHKPELIAERVYGLGNPRKAKELGNTRKGDGWKFRGNGMLQLTGGDSHKRIGQLTGFDLYDRPEQLEDPAISFEVAAAEFEKLNCLPAADADNVTLVTRRVNGGRNGLAERTVWLRKWKAALATYTADDAEEVEEKVALIEAPVPPPPEPRGGESDPVKPMTQSTIGNGAIVAGTGGFAALAAQAWDALKETPQSILDALIAAAQKPAFWAAAVVVVAGAFIWWKRYRLKQDAGV